MVLAKIADERYKKYENNNLSEQLIEIGHYTFSLRVGTNKTGRQYRQ